MPKLKDLFKTSGDGVSFLTPIYTFGYAKTEDQSDNPIFDFIRLTSLKEKNDDLLKEGED